MEKFYVPISIMFAGLVIGAAILYTNTSVQLPSVANQERVQQNDQVTPERELALVDPRREENRNLMGPADAPVTVVEFSDYECPFCARLHPTLEALVENHEGNVAWEYRHLPLVSHRNARPAAIAAECVRDLAGNEAFWTFSNYLFASQRTLGEQVYVTGAAAVGVLDTDLLSCMEREDIAERVLEDERTAVTLGGSGTPFSVIVYEDGSTRTVPGALPYAQFDALVKR